MGTLLPNSLYMNLKAYKVLSSIVVAYPYPSTAHPDGVNHTQMLAIARAATRNGVGATGLKGRG